MSKEGVSAEQIPLPFGNFERFDFESYLPGPHQQVVHQLQRIVVGEEITNVYLWGTVGTGKSHLLQALCSQASDHQRTAAYIPFSQIDNFSPALLQGLEQLDIVCIDDLQQISGREE